MSFFNFNFPESWPGYRDIDERVVYDPKNEEEDQESEEEELAKWKPTLNIQINLHHFE